MERPSYERLANVTTYTSATTRWQGNPSLDSSETLELGINALYKDLYVSCGVQTIRHEIFEVNLASDEDERILIVKPVNLPKHHCCFLDASYSFHYGIWHPALNASFQYQDLSYGVPLRKYNKMLGELLIDNRFGFKNDWNIWLLWGYRTKGNYATGYTYGYKNLGFTVSKSFLNRALQLKLDCRDILNKGRERIKVETNNLSMTDASVGNTQFIKLTVIYKLNKLPVKYKGGGVSIGEMNRLKRGAD